MLWCIGYRLPWAPRLGYPHAWFSYLVAWSTQAVSWRLHGCSWSFFPSPLDLGSGRRFLEFWLAANIGSTWSLPRWSILSCTDGGWQTGLVGCPGCLEGTITLERTEMACFPVCPHVSNHSSVRAPESHRSTSHLWKANRQSSAKGGKSQGKGKSQPPALVDPRGLRVEDGLFMCGEIPLSQLPLSQVGPSASGVVLCTSTEAEPLLKTGRPISTGALVLIIVDQVSSPPATVLLAESVRFPTWCIANSEPLLLDGLLYQVRAQQVTRSVANDRFELVSVATCVIKFMLFRDQLPVSWDSVVAHPVKYLLSTLPMLKVCSGCDNPAVCEHWHEDPTVKVSDPLMEVWGRQFLTIAYHSSHADKADIFSVHMRLPISLEEAVLQQSGRNGLYCEPKEIDGKRPSASYQVCWMPKSSYQEIVHLRQITRGVSGIARMGQRYGIRCRLDRAEEIHAALKPGGAYLPQGRKSNYIMGPMPFGTLRTSVMQIVEMLPWAARPMQPITAASHIQGVMWRLQAVEPPPRHIVQTDHGEVLICRVDEPSQTSASRSCVVGARHTLSLIAAQGDKGIDILQVNDPWEQAVNRGIATGPKAACKASDPVEVLEQKVVNAVIAKLPPAAMEVDGRQEDVQLANKVAVLEQQVQELHSNQTKMHALVTEQGQTQSSQIASLQIQSQRMESAISDQAGKLGSFQVQFKQQLERQQGQLDSLFQQQMDKIEDLFQKKPRTSWGCPDGCFSPASIWEVVRRQFLLQSFSALIILLCAGVLQSEVGVLHPTCPALPRRLVTFLDFAVGAFSVWTLVCCLCVLGYWSGAMMVCKHRWVHGFQSRWSFGFGTQPLGVQVEFPSTRGVSAKALSSRWWILLLMICCRVGEASHPGPSEGDGSSWSVGLCNPSGIHSKVSQMNQLEGDVWFVCETHLSQYGVSRFRKGLVASRSEFKHFVHGAPCVSRSSSQVGGYSDVGVLSRIPLRALPHSFCAESFDTARIQVVGFVACGVWIQAGVLYGYPDSQQFLERTFQTDCLLHELVDRIAIQGQGPRLICGDFNHSQSDLRNCERLRQLGFCEAQSFALYRWGIPIQTTSRGKSPIDQIWLSAELQQLLQSVEIRDSDWADHSSIVCHFTSHLEQFKTFHWRMPQAVSWPTQWNCWPQIDWTQDPFLAYASFWFQVESACESQVGLLPASAKGRGQTLDSRQSFRQTPPCKIAREGDFQPRFHGPSLQHLQWVKQLRRCQSLRRLLASSSTNDLHRLRLAEVWSAIRLAKGFAGGFCAWWAEHFPSHEFAKNGFPL